MEVYQTSRYILWLPELLGLIKTSGQSTEEKDVQIAKIGTVFIPGFTELYLGILTGIIWTALIYILYLTLVSGQFYLAIPGVLIHTILIYKSEDKVRAYHNDNDPYYPNIEYEEGKRQYFPIRILSSKIKSSLELGDFLIC